MSFHEQHEYIKRPGCTINYWIYGKTRKPDIFMAHGAGVDHHQFDKQIHYLQDDYQIISWDMRGHGSSRPLNKPFRIVDAMEDMIAILEALGREDSIFMGQSAGTYIIQELAFQHPERVKAMIIIDGTCITAKLSILESLSIRISPLIFRLWPYENLKKAMVEASSIKPDIKQYLKKKFNELSKEEYVKIWDGISTCVHYEPSYHVHCPLLLVYGEHDKLGNIKKAMKKWAERDNQSKYGIIPYAGHVSNQDNPEYFNKMMMEFLMPLTIN
jgi:3-oxoadipate enol-lactonase